MKIDLLKFVENNNEIQELKNEVEFKKELNKLISNIITGEENFYTNNEELIDKLDLKFEKAENYGRWLVINSFSCQKDYKVKLTKTNIRKVQDYINKEE